MNVFWLFLGCVNTLTTGMNALTIYYAGPDLLSIVSIVISSGLALWCFSKIETEELE
jgi:hypothetical protein